MPAPQGVLGMVWTPWPVCGGASVFWGLGLHLLAGVRVGQGVLALGDSNAPTLSLVSVGMRPWSRVYAVSETSPSHPSPQTRLSGQYLM